MKSRLLLTMLATTSALIGGCAVHTVQEPYYRHEHTVAVAPPPPIYENPGYPPSAGYLWINGYWNWTNIRYVWVPGRWEAPRHGYYWVPHRWEREGNHWRQHGGTWEREVRPKPVQAAPPVHAQPPSGQESQLMRLIQQQASSRAPSPPPVVRPEPEHTQKPSPVVVPKEEHDTRRPAEQDGKQRVEHKSPHPAAGAAPERRDESRAKSDATPRPAPSVAPTDGRDGRRPNDVADKQRMERRSAPAEVRPAPERRDESPAKSDVTSRPDHKDSPRRPGHDKDDAH
jgi:hypothetical protein